MRILCAILAFFIVTGSLFAEEGAKKNRKSTKIIYSEEGYLVNAGEEDLLKSKS